MIYTYPNANASDADAGTIHWYLKLNFQEPVSVTVSPTAILIEYAVALTTTQKTTLNSIMSTPITWRFIDYVVSLSQPKLQTLITNYLKSIGISVSIVLVNVAIVGSFIEIKLSTPLTAAQLQNVKTTLGNARISSIMT